MNATESLFVRFVSFRLAWQVSMGPPGGHRVSKQPLNSLIGVAGSSYMFSMKLLCGWP